MTELDVETKLKLYMLIVNRYKDLISEKEEQSITELRNRISPYNDFIRELRKRLSEGHDIEADFLSVVQKFILYIRKVKNFEFLFNFWMKFEEIDEIGAAPVMDQALLLTSLLRSIDAKDPRVYITKSERIYITFEHNGDKYLVIPETGSLLVGNDVKNVFDNDKPAYSFSDLVYENYEE